MKTCNKCGGTDFYAGGSCKPCARLRAKQYKQINPEKVRLAKQKWQSENRDKVNLSSAKTRNNNIEKYKEKEAVSRSKNKAKISISAKNKRLQNVIEARKKDAEKYAKDPKAALAASQKWRTKFPGKSRAIWHNRQARKIASGGVLSIGLAEKLFALQKGKCPCCGLPLGENYHMDHKMPLALGGPNVDDNMQLLRQHCNTQKSAKHPIDFMQSRGFLL